MKSDEEKGLDIIFSKLTNEDNFFAIKEGFDDLGIDVFYRMKSGEIKLKPINVLFEELSEKWVSYNG